MRKKEIISLGMMILTMTNHELETTGSVLRSLTEKITSNKRGETPVLFSCLRGGMEKSISITSQPQRHTRDAALVSPARLSIVDSPAPLSHHQLDLLLLWKQQPGITFFTEKLELHVSSIANSIKKWEGDVLSEEDIKQLMKSFELTNSNTDSKLQELAQTFVKDVYTSLVRSKDPASKAAAYYKNEFKIYHLSGLHHHWEKDADDLLDYLQSLDFQVTRYYEEYEAYLEGWKSQMKEIQRQMKYIYSKNGNKAAKPGGYMYQELLQTKARCGDPVLFSSIHDHFLRQNSSLDPLLHFLLNRISGLRSKNFFKLAWRTQVIFDDLLSTLKLEKDFNP